MAFHCGLIDSKSLQVSKTLLSILANLNNAVARMVTTRPLISKSSSPCTNPFVVVRCVPITTGITVNFMFHKFFSSFARSKYLSLFQFYPMVSRTAKSSFGRISFFFTTTRSGRLAEIRWSVRISKTQTILCVSFSRTDSGLSIYHLFVWSKLNSLHYSL